MGDLKYLLHGTLLVVANVDGHAQAYAPFSPGTKKLFSSFPVHTSGLEIAFDSTTIAEGTTTYHNYKALQDTLTPSGCAWWVGTDCRHQDKATWIGPRIEQDEQGVHRFFTVLNDTVTLHLATTSGAPMVMYADADQRFLLDYSGAQAEEVLGITENVRKWTVLHQDAGGNTINSALNNATVAIGETIGLIRFFRIDSFPSVLEPVELIGQSGPSLGLHVITPAVLHDFQPGDEVQSEHYAQYVIGPASQNFDFVRKIRILEREDTPTSVVYQAEVTTLQSGSTAPTVQTTSLSYSKTTILATLPLLRYQGTGTELDLEDYCAAPLWTYTTNLNGGVGYCQEENCWGGIDTNGPPPSGYTTLALGLGVYDSLVYVSGPAGYTTSTRIVYFKKNGISCGTEVTVGLTESSAPDDLAVFPIPSTGTVTVRSASPVQGIQVFDQQGRSIAALTDTARGTIDLGRTPDGLYTLHVLFADGTRAQRKVVIQH
ncbi:MAG: T9SS type A sorting domain-containing protein [Flavobacteriales bacterium]